MLHRVLCRVRLPHQGCHLLQRRKVCTLVVQSKGPFWSTQSFADSKTFLATSTPCKPKYSDMMLYSSNNWTRPAPETRPRGTLRQGATARARGFARSSATWQARWVPMSQPCRIKAASFPKAPREPTGSTGRAGPPLATQPPSSHPATLGTRAPVTRSGALPRQAWGPGCRAWGSPRAPAAHPAAGAR